MKIKSVDLYFTLFMLNTVLGLVYIVQNGVLIGDLKGVLINKKIVIIVGFFFLIFNLLVYKLFNLEINLNIKQLKLKNKLDIIMIFILLWNFFITFKYGLGKAYAQPVSGGKIMLYLFPISNLMYIYIALQDKNSKLYFINCILFFILNFIRGWSGFILIVFVIVLAKKNFKISFNKILFLNVAGFFTYFFIKPFKDFMRGNLFVHYSILEFIERYLGRFTPVSNPIYFINNYGDLKGYLGNDYSFFKELIFLYLPSSVSGSFQGFSKSLALFHNGATKATWELSLFLKWFLSFKYNYIGFIGLLLLLFLINQFVVNWHPKFKTINIIMLTQLLITGSFTVYFFHIIAVIEILLFMLLFDFFETFNMIIKTKLGDN